MRNCLDTRNTRGVSALLDAGYRRESVCIAYRIERGQRRWEESDGVLPYEPRWHDEVLAIHEDAFPGTWFPLEEMIRLHEKEEGLFVALEDHAVRGYAFVRWAPGAATGAVEFLAVKPGERGRGYGRRLLMTALKWMLEDAGLEAAVLRVEEGNAPARALYESVGFRVVCREVDLVYDVAPARRAGRAITWPS